MWKRRSFFEHLTRVREDIRNNSIRIRGHTFWVRKQVVTSDDHYASIIVGDLIKQQALVLIRKGGLSSEELRVLWNTHGYKRIYKVEVEKMEELFNQLPRITTVTDWREFLHPTRNGVAGDLRPALENIILRCRSMQKGGRKELDTIIRVLRMERYRMRG